MPTKPSNKITQRKPAPPRRAKAQPYNPDAKGKANQKYQQIAPKRWTNKKPKPIVKKPQVNKGQGPGNIGK